MARLPRIDIAEQAFHVVQRGNNRQDIFFEEDDYNHFLSLLREFSTVFACDIHAYVLMTNHVHLLATQHKAGGISAMMQFIGRRYVRYINKKYERSGTLWEGRYKSSPIENGRYFLTCMRYIELNPVRARMVRKPGSYVWSSYGRNALGEVDGVVTSHGLYVRLGRTAETRRQSYAALFDDAIAQDDLDAIRKGAHGGWAVGDAEFADVLARRAGQRVTPAVRGGDRRSKKFTRKATRRKNRKKA